MINFNLTSTFKFQKPKFNEFANNLDPDEVANNELPHLDLYCLPSSLWILNYRHSFDQTFFEELQA